MNRYVHGNGSGKLADAVSASGNVITLAAVSAGSDEAAVPVGREIMVANKTTGAFPGGHPAVGVALVISAVDFSVAAAPTITVLNEDGTIPTLTGVTSSFGVYIRDAQGHSLFGLGVMCVPGNPSDYGTAAFFGGIDRTTFPFWNPAEVDAAVGGVNQVVSIQKHVQPLLSRIDKACGAKFGGKLLGFCGYDVWYGLANSMGRNQRTDYVMKLKGGYDAIQYNQLYVAIDFMAPVNTLRAVSPRTTYRYIMDEWFWEDETGSIMERVYGATGRPTNVFRLNMLSRQQFVSVQCKSNGSIKNLAAAA
jgi:hypothetical protein